MGKHTGKSKPNGSESPSNGVVQGIISKSLGDERCKTQVVSKRSFNIATVFVTMSTNFKLEKVFWLKVGAGVGKRQKISLKE